LLSVKILGSGCYNCYVLEQIEVGALESLAQEKPDLEVTIEHIEQVEEIMKYSIMFTPGLVIDEKLVSDGRIPSHEEVRG